MKIAVLPPCFLQLSVYGRSATFEITDKEGHFFFFSFSIILAYYTIIINIKHFFLCLCTRKTI